MVTCFVCVFIYSFLQVQRRWASNDGAVVEWQWGSCRMAMEAFSYDPARWRLRCDGRSVVELE